MAEVRIKEREAWKLGGYEAGKPGGSRLKVERMGSILPI